MLAIALIDNRHHGLGQIDEGQSGGGVAAEGSWFAAVTAVADALNQRYLCQQGHVHFLGQLLAAFLAEDIVAVLRQFGRREPCHVLDKSQDRHVDLLVAIHVNSLACIGQRHLLGRADDNGTRDGQRLQQCQVDIRGTRGCVQDKVVQFAPVGIGNELFQRIGGHTATPEGSRLGIDEETDAEQFDAIGLHRLNELATIHLDSIGAGILHVEHLRHRRSEDIGV